MLLEAADPNRFRSEITQIVAFITRKQIKSGPGAGGWDYPDGFKNKYVGDTSMAQYAMLAFWAAQRANIPVDLGVVDRCAAWHMRTQLSDGGFAYHPSIASGAGTGNGNSTGNMTAGGASSLGMAKVMLYKAAEGKKKEKLFGVLEAIEDKPAEKVERKYTATVSKSAIEKGMQRSYGWVKARLRPSMTGQVS